MMPFAATQMQLESIILSEVSQKEKDKYHMISLICMGFQVALVVKNLPANAGDGRALGLTPGSGRFPGEGNGNPLQYFCLENPMDRGAWKAIVHKVTELDRTEAT